MLRRCVIFLILIACHWQCESRANSFRERLEYSKDTLSYIRLGILPNNDFRPDTVVDLRGKTCIIPNGVKIDLRVGGFKNGRLIGNNTKLICGDRSIDRVKIEGTWIVHNIKTSYFKDLTYVNALSDVMALTNPKIKNKVSIEPNYYNVEATKDIKSIIRIPSNTKVRLNGIVYLLPNALEEYDIFLVEGTNISISGKGEIVGDKSNHIGLKGEWGMGIRIRNSKDIDISGIRIRECWGDCIYIGGNSTNVNIRSCYLSNGRRQGISITSAVNVKIFKCTISDIGGTNPEYAIDVEPNDNCICDNIVIEDLNVTNCGGGVLAYGRARNAKIGLVQLEKCKILGSRKVPLRFEKCENIMLKRIKLLVTDIKKGMYIVEVDNFKNK
ncbi:Right handed beta helix region [Prevotellaceae bacterium HUN156]|nr:Right handed beta helix region [Prevotellaceae bacterium HUN156]